MSQSNVIFAAIFIAYIVFITVKGELSIYMGFLFSSAPSQNPNTSPTGGFTITPGQGNPWANAPVIGGP